MWSSGIVSHYRVGHVCCLQTQSQIDSAARARNSPLGFDAAAFLANLTAHVTVCTIYSTKTSLEFALACCPPSSVVF